MPMTAMVSVSFSAQGNAAEKFSSEMDKLDWIKVPNVDNAWAANFPNANFQDANAQQLICEHAAEAVLAAAKLAGVGHYHAAVHVGSTIPTLFNGP